MTPGEPLLEPAAGVDEEALRKAEEFIEKEEGAASHFKGWTDHALTAVAVLMSLFHLYAAQAIIPAQILRAIHVAFVLFLCFLFSDRLGGFYPPTSLSFVSRVSSTRPRS